MTFPEDYEPDCRDISADYLVWALEGIRRDYPAYYTLLEHAPTDVFAVHMLFDYRLARRTNTPRWEYDEWLREYTLQEFLSYAGTFHRYDTFGAWLLNGPNSMESMFYPKYVQEEMAKHITEAYIRSSRRKGDCTVAWLLETRYGLPPGMEETARVIARDVYEIIRIRLQRQYDMLKGLDFIVK